jgi:hypothetical protein
MRHNCTSLCYNSSNLDHMHHLSYGKITILMPTHVKKTNRAVKACSSNQNAQQFWLQLLIHQHWMATFFIQCKIPAVQLAIIITVASQSHIHATKLRFIEWKKLNMSNNYLSRNFDISREATNSQM